MTSFVLCLMVLLSLSSVFGQNQEPHQACISACMDYSRMSYYCAMDDNCFDKQQTDPAGFQSCMSSCFRAEIACHTLCNDSYADLKGECADKCDDASIMDVSCEEGCISEKFLEQHGDELPDLTLQQVGVWEGIPGLEEDEDVDEEEDDLFDEELLEKRDSDLTRRDVGYPWSTEEDDWWGEESEDFDDGFFDSK